MSAEARRQFTRIALNYTRLGSTFVIGIVVTRLQVGWLGGNGFGLIALLVSTIGLGSMFDDLSRQSLIRELGKWHAVDEERFLRAYNSSFLLSGLAAGITAALFVVILIVLPYLKIDPPLLWGARVFLIARGVAQTLIAILRPALAMYIVRERFGAFNVYSTLMRLNDLVAIVLLIYVFSVDDIATGVALYGVAPAALNIVLVTLFVGSLWRADPQLIPRISFITRAAVREISGTFAWNSGVILAMNLHDRVASIIMNIAFGLWGNTVFGLAYRLINYVRMATTGVTFGVDASAARMSSAGQHGRLRKLLYHSTRAHALIAFPAAVIIAVLAEPLLSVWIGARLKDPSSVLPQTTTLVRIMIIGLVGRAISDGWFRILYGAGLVRKYAPVVMIGGVLSPLIAILLIRTLPDPVAYTGIAWGYVVLLVTLHCGVAPALCAEPLGVRTRDFLTPLIRPALVAALSAPILLLRSRVSEALGSSILGMFTVVVMYVGVYTVLAALIAFSSMERRRLIGIALGHTPRS